MEIENQEELPEDYFNEQSGCPRDRLGRGKDATGSILASSSDSKILWKKSKNCVDCEYNENLNGNMWEKVHSMEDSTEHTHSDDECGQPLLSNNEESSDSMCHIHDVCHCHQSPIHRENTVAGKQLLVALIMCVTFMIAEILGGYIAGSLSIMTDAAHLLSDCAGFLVGLLSLWLGRQPPTNVLSFGYYRAEVLGAVISIFIIWIMTGIFIYLAVMRLVEESFTINPNYMMIVAGFGVIINILMSFVLHGKCFGHKHNHSNSKSHASDSTERRNYNINVRAAIIHTLGDMIQSIGVFISAIVIKIYPNAKMTDPICTILFSVIVVITTTTIIKDAIHILMEGLPKTMDYFSILRTLQSIRGVKHVHGLHVWALTLDKNALTVHLAVDTAADRDAVLRESTKIVQKIFHISISTIQIERYDEMAVENCLQCKLPIN